MTLSATCTAKIWAGPSQTTLSVRPRMEMTVLFAGIPIRDDGKPSAECLTPTGSRNRLSTWPGIRRVPESAGPARWDSTSSVGEGDRFRGVPP